MSAESTGLQRPTRVWIDKWQSGHPCLAIAVEIELIESIEGECHLRGWRLAWIQPWWAGAIGAVPETAREPALVAFDDQDSLVLIGGTNDAFSFVAFYDSVSRPQIGPLVARMEISSNTSWARRLLVTRKGVNPVLDATALLQTSGASPR